MIAEAKAKAQAIAAKARAARSGLSFQPPPPPPSSGAGAPLKPSPPPPTTSKVEAIRSRIAAQKEKSIGHRNNSALQTSLPPVHGTLGIGLNTAIHPLLLGSDTGSSTVGTKSGGRKDQKNNASSAAKLSFPTNNKYLAAIPTEAKTGNNPYFDEKLQASHESKREALRRRGLVFNAKGKFIEKANEIRREAEQAELEKRMEEERLKNSHKIEGVETDAIANEKQIRPEMPPMVEWWDEGLLLESTDEGKSYESSGINFEPITIYIQHPVPIPAPWEKYQPKETKFHLTKKETKRLRKNTRAERHKEKQDRIRLGLDPAPPPKVKLSNLMSVLTNEAIKDPTLVEIKVKKDIAQRAQQHVDMNQERKLTQEQRYEKILQKLEQDKEKHGIYSAAFKIRFLGDPKHKYKVNIVAQQKSLTGITIFNPKFNLVIVEGGYHAVKYYMNLMTRRIKWTEKAPPREDPDNSPNPPDSSTSERNGKDNGEEGADHTTPELVQPVIDMSTNKCTMIWMGQIKTNSFNRWSVRSTETEQEAKDILARYNASHFWVEAHSLEDS